MSKKLFYIACFGLLLLAVNSAEARCCRSRFGVNFNFANPTPPPTVVYYSAPMYPAPVYYAAPAPVYHAPVVVYQPVQRVYYRQPTSSVSFGWTFR